MTQAAAAPEGPRPRAWLLPGVVGLAFVAVELFRVPALHAWLDADSDVLVPGILSGTILARAGRDHFYLPSDPFYNVEAFDGLTRGLPLHELLWSYWPPLSLLLAAAACWWAARCLFGARPALPGLALAVSMSPPLLRTVLPQTFHVTTWVTTLLLGALLVLLTSSWARRRPRTLVAVLLFGAAFTGLNLASDPLLAATGLLPFVAAGSMTALLQRRRAAVRVAVLAAAFTVASALTALAVSVAMGSAGFVLPPVSGANLAAADQAVRNLALAGHGVWFVLSGRSSTVSAPDGLVAALLLAVFAVLLICLPALALRRQGAGRETAPLPRTVYVAYWSMVVAAPVLAFSLSRFPDGVTTWRYVASAYFGLAWLAVPIAASGVRAANLVAVASALYCAANLGALLTWDPVPNRAAPPAEMSAWLSDRGLRTGYASYVDAHVLTWRSAGVVSVRPVVQGASCRAPDPGAVCPYLYTTAAGWYAGSATGPTFLVVDPPVAGVDTVTAGPAAGLGVPLEVHAIGAWRIFVYADDIAARFLPGVTVAAEAPASR